MKRKKNSVDLESVAVRIHAATETRCACGDHGSWDHTVSGTSGETPCVWAGCPNCSGSAVGVPVMSGAFAAWQTLSLVAKQELIAVAAIRRVFGETITIDPIIDTHRNAYHVFFRDGDSPTYSRAVKFVDGDIVLLEKVRGHRA